MAAAQKQAGIAAFVSYILMYTLYLDVIGIYVCAKIDDLLCQSETIVREGLAAIIKREMVEAYDNLW